MKDEIDGFVDLASFKAALKTGEDFLLGRLRDYATESEYTRYASTKEDDWRMTLREPARLLLEYLDSHNTPELIHVDEDFEENPSAAFGVLEAKLHRQRGVGFDMFLGLCKLARQAFVDLVYETDLTLAERRLALDITHRFWDKFELGFSAEWVRCSESDLLKELQETNRSMTNEKNKYLTFFRAAAEPSFVVDRNMTVMDVNPAMETFLGASASDMCGRPCWDVLSCESCDPCPLRAAIRDSSEFAGIEMKIPLEGKRRTVLFSGSFLNDISGKYSGGLAVLRDITARKEAAEERRALQEQAMHAQRLESLSVLAGGVAHEFNNLLMVVSGNAEILRSRLAPQSSFQGNVDSIKVAAGRAADLAYQMLAFSGRGRFVVERRGLGEIVRDAEDLLRGAVDEGISLEFRLDDSVPEVEADVTQVGQLLLGLVANASEAIAGPAGRIAVTTGAMQCDSAGRDRKFVVDERPSGTYSYVEVSDNGAGMDRDTVDRMFEPFYSTKFAGRGLGLAAAFGIVRGHQGAIEVDSEPGTGSRIRVLFPAAEETLDRPAGAPEVTEDCVTVGKVLLADDEPAVLDVGRLMLESLGYEVKTASDGQEALASFREQAEDIDVALIDLSMPGMGGEKVCEEIGKIDSRVPVILMSGYPESDIEARFGTKRFDGFLQKPYGLDQLRTSLQEVRAKSNGNGKDCSACPLVGSCSSAEASQDTAAF